MAFTYITNGLTEGNGVTSRDRVYKRYAASSLAILMLTSKSTSVPDFVRGAQRVGCMFDPNVLVGHVGLNICGFCYRASFMSPSICHVCSIRCSAHLRILLDHKLWLHLCKSRITIPRQDRKKGQLIIVMRRT